MIRERDGASAPQLHEVRFGVRRCARRQQFTSGLSRRNVAAGRRHRTRSCTSASPGRALPRGSTSGVSVARYYDPTTAQFLTRDPLEAVTQSAYGYVAGDPLDGADPSGLCSLFSWGGDGCIAQAAAVVPGGDSLDNALTSFVRFGDEVTFGASHWVRHEVGLGDAIDECSDAYNSQAAVAASMVFMMVDGEGEAAAARAALKFTEDQQALVKLAQLAKRSGVSLDDAQTLLKWADEVGLPARGPEIHPNRPFVNFWHIHVGPVDHIPVIL